MADAVNQTFYEFHFSMLTKRGKVHNENAIKILSDANVEKLRTAFTHPSYDPNHNYQLFELLGDGTVNEFIIYYVKGRFPKIVSVKWLTRIKHNLVSKKQLAFLARKEGLEAHIRIGQEIEELKKKAPKDIKNYYATSKGKDKDYISVLEDVMEAYFGCLILIIEDVGYTHGTAVQVCHNILSSFFDNEEIELEYTKIFDAITRLKELVESNAKGWKWPYDKVLTTMNMPHGSPHAYRVIVYSWHTMPDKKYVPGKGTVIVDIKGDSKEELKQRAAQDAIRILQEKGIKEEVKDMYQK